MSPQQIIIKAQEVYGPCTTQTIRQIPLALQPSTVEEVKMVLHMAHRFGIPVYPISTGHNWGYGTSNPVASGSVILDLSKLNQILEFNEELRWVRVQPGVTQQQLYDFLAEKGLQFMVPVTGAGPDCSLLGNLLERGYGITPIQDHFESLLALKAILADGREFQDPFTEMNCSDLANNFKWGLGPYITGLFSQSNLGVVIEATIALVQRPEAVSAFVFTLDSNVALAQAVEAIRKIRYTLGTSVGGINLMNNRRMLSMTVPYPKNHIEQFDIIPDAVVKELCGAHNIALWTGVGGLYGTKEMVKASQKFIRKVLKPFVKDLKFANPSQLKILKTLSSLTPHFVGGKKLVDLAGKLQTLMDVIEGRPTKAALPLAYWKSGKSFDPQTSIDPAKDRCGLLWYSPLVPMVSEKVESYVAFVERSCRQYGIEPLITLTSISDRCFDSTVPILFNPNDSDETQRAREFHRAALEDGRDLGFFPYRLGIDQMATLTSQKDSVYWNLVASIKKAVDPKNILSPGRYCKRNL